jgi:hypothetical protein
LNAVSPGQFDWTIKASRKRIDFLDVTIRTSSDFLDTGAFRYSLYRKPSFQPQYLHYLSGHTTACKAAIFKSLSHRCLVLSTEPSDYYSEMTRARGYLLERAYPSALLHIVPYDEKRRQFILAKLYRSSREPFTFADVKKSDQHRSVSSPGEKVLRIIMPYAPSFPFSLLRTELRVLYRRCIRHGITLPPVRIGSKNLASAFRLDYGLNNPFSAKRQR